MRLNPEGKPDVCIKQLKKERDEYREALRKIVIAKTHNDERLAIVDAMDLLKREKTR